MLGIPPGSTVDEIKRAYREKAREHHPDRGGDPARMQEINVAYERAIEMASAGSEYAPTGETLDDVMETFVGAAHNFLWKGVVNQTSKFGRLQRPARTAAHATLDVGRELLLSKLRSKKSP